MDYNDRYAIEQRVDRLARETEKRLARMEKLLAEIHKAVTRGKDRRAHASSSG